MAERASRARRGILFGDASASTSQLSDLPSRVEAGDHDLSFKAIVEQVTEALTAQLDLPNFETWASAYRLDPSRYDEEMLGLWREPL